MLILSINIHNDLNYSDTQQSGHSALIIVYANCHNDTLYKDIQHINNDHHNGLNVNTQHRQHSAMNIVYADCNNDALYKYTQYVCSILSIDIHKLLILALSIGDTQH